MYAAHSYRPSVLSRCLAGALLLFTAGANVCAADIEVLALFRDQAVIRVDGQRYKLALGESTPEGVRLVSADAAGAVLEHAGDTRRYPLGAKLRVGGYRQADGDTVRVYRDPHGMFTTVGSINGLPVSFLVDTGASSVAMNAAQARRLGIDFRVEGERGSVMTASRAEPVYRVMLDMVRIGNIQLRNVEAVVLDGPQPQQTLLGMSFLGRLDIQNDGEHLTLRRKY
ncbi:MAG: TIGR02281 family clan AA aspartic protease [Gammaproteobacteria bacterium]|nr:TIGR02281 family clan AA aspartic protease [Gammaproteobacteria bacterium]